MLNLIKFLLQILPLIHPVVQAVEQLIPGAGQGAAKLDAATTIVEGLLPTIGATVDQIAQMRAPLQSTISSVVSIANKSGTLWTTKDGQPITAPNS